MQCSVWHEPAERIVESPAVVDVGVDDGVGVDSTDGVHVVVVVGVDDGGGLDVGDAHHGAVVVGGGDGHVGHRRPGDSHGQLWTSEIDHLEWKVIGNFAGLPDI